jgi:hypothetical protein
MYHVTPFERLQASRPKSGYSPVPPTLLARADEVIE